MVACCRHNSQLVQGKSSASASGQQSAESWYVVDRIPVVTPRPSQRKAVRSTKNIGYYDRRFQLSTEAGRRFGPFTEQNIRQAVGHCPGAPVANRTDHQPAASMTPV